MRSIFITVGTDHHPFDRLVEWADEWIGRQDPGTASCLVQYGHARPPRRADGTRFMRQDELWAALTAADVVVTHGGPATILEAERQHHTPLCVPRDPRWGEHVDEHQVRFSQVMAARGRVHLVEGRDEFLTFLDNESTRRQRGADATASVLGAPEGMDRLAAVVTDVTRARRGRRRG